MAVPRKDARPAPSKPEGGGPKLGRPRVAEDAKRSTLVRVLTTEAEYELFKRAAEDKGMSVSTWMRSIALEQTRETRDAE